MKIFLSGLLRTATILCLAILISGDETKAQDPKLYFTREKNFDFAKVDTYNSFSPGDTIYGLLLVPNRPAYSYQFSLNSYAVEENGEAVIPVSLGMGGRQVTIQFKVPLSSGISTKKKSGLLKLISDDGDTHGFYFQVFPAGGKPINDEWVKWFGSLASTTYNKEINVTVGPVSENLTSSFTINMSKGAGIYSDWGAAYLADLKEKQDAQKRKQDSMLLAEKNKTISDSLDHASYIQKLLIESDKSPVPVSKIKKPAVEALLIAYADLNESDGIKILKAYIYSDDGYHSDHEYVVNYAYKINTDNSGMCYLLPAKVKTENPLNEKEYVKEFNWYSIKSRQWIRCSRLPGSKQ